MSTPATWRAMGSDLDDMGPPPAGCMFVVYDVLRSDALVLTMGAVTIADTDQLDTAREHEAQAVATCERRTAERDQAYLERDAVARELAKLIAERDVSS